MFLPGWSSTATLPLLFYLRARHCHHHHRPAAGTVFSPVDRGGQCYYDRLCDAQGPFSCRRAGSLRDLITNLPAFCVLWGASLQRPIGMPCTLLPRPCAFRRRPKTSRRTSSLPNKPTPSLKMGESPTTYRSCRPAGPSPTREYADSPSHYPPQADP
jgi:hypothetical protein